MVSFTPMTPSTRHRPLTRRAFLGGAVGLAAATLAACTSSGSDNTTSTTETTPSTGPSGAPATGDPSRPQRVVALSTGHLDHLLVLGIVPVGLAVAKSTGTDVRGIPDYITERFGDSLDLSSIEIVGVRQSPDLEKIAQLHPDLILSNNRSEKAQLDQLRGIATVVTTNGGAEQWKDDLGIVGDALGLREKSDQLLADYEEQARTWASSRGDSPSVSLVRGRNTEYVLTGPLSLAGSVVADAGFTRPAGQDFTDTANHDLSLENTDQLEADHLFYAFEGGAEQVVDSASWKALSVVSRGDAHQVDIDPWFLNASLVAAERVLDDLKRMIGE